MEQEDRENCKQELGQKNKRIYVKGVKSRKSFSFTVSITRPKSELREFFCIINLINRMFQVNQ